MLSTRFFQDINVMSQRLSLGRHTPDMTAMRSEGCEEHPEISLLPRAVENSDTELLEVTTSMPSLHEAKKQKAEATQEGWKLCQVLLHRRCAGHRTRKDAC